MRPLVATPTTHILKLPLGLVGNIQMDMSASVETEWLCAQVIKAYGLPVADCDMAQFEDIEVLVVQRFDRVWSSDRSWLIRLPQEDMCQAMGCPSHWKMQEILPSHWHALAKRHGISSRGVDSPFEQVIEQTPAVVEAVTCPLPAVPE